MKKIALFLTSIIFISCTNIEEIEFYRVKFEGSQPINTKELKKFPISLKARYKLIDNEFEQIEIGKSSIVRFTETLWKTTRYDLEIDSTEKIDLENDSSLIAYCQKESKGKVELLGDSLYIVTTYIDTIFEIGSSNILKKKYGSFFLSYMDEDSLFSVKRINKNKDTLFFGQITPSDTLLQYDYSSVLNPNDTINEREYLLNSSNKDFKNLNKDEMFETVRAYVRVR
jgi:hypothetical protein